MSHSGQALKTLELWEASSTYGDGTPDEVPALLRALSVKRRLNVLRLLAEGHADAETIAALVRVPRATVRRDIDVLREAGLVRDDPQASAEVYQLAQHAIRLLGSSLTYGIHDFPKPYINGGERSPSPPLACTLCDNRHFVSKVLGELNVALTDARQYHGQIKEMSSQVLTAHEAERKRIARELHDDTAQALTSILVRLRLLERSTQDTEVLQNVKELRDLTAGALDSVRRMAMDLRPAALDDLGLVPALQAYAEKFTQRWRILVKVSADGLVRRLPPEVELVLYRIVQEALMNVAKHAGARTAGVSLARQRNLVTLTIDDDGAGFDAGASRRTDGTGLGLFGMGERLALVGGELIIESARGKGTRVIARVPLAGHRTRKTGVRA